MIKKKNLGDHRKKEMTITTTTIIIIITKIIYTTKHTTKTYITKQYNLKTKPQTFSPYSLEAYRSCLPSPPLPPQHPAPPSPHLFTLH